MTILPEANELLNRYLQAAARRLPMKNRDDIIRELRSSILDEAESRSGDEDIDLQSMRSILTDRGAPGKYADAYAPHQYLIGPAVFPLFRIVLAIVWTILLIISAISLGIMLLQSGPAGLLTWLAELIGTLAASLGVLVLVFFILEKRSDQEVLLDKLYETWSFEDLPELKKAGPLKRSEQIINVVLTAAAIFLLLRFSGRIGVYTSTGTSCIFLPILQEGFYQILPVIIFRWSLTIVLSLLLLYRGKETRGLMIFGIILNAFDISILLYMLSRGVGTFFDLSVLQKAGIEPLEMLLGPLMVGIFILIIVLSVVEIVKAVRSLRDLFSVIT